MDRSGVERKWCPGAGCRPALTQAKSLTWRCFSNRSQRTGRGAGSRRWRDSKAQLLSQIKRFRRRKPTCGLASEIESFQSYEVTEVSACRTVRRIRTRISTGTDTVGGRPSCRRCRTCSCYCSCHSSHRLLPLRPRRRHHMPRRATDNILPDNQRSDDLADRRWGSPGGRADRLSDARVEDVLRRRSVRPGCARHVSRRPDCERHASRPPVEASAASAETASPATPGKGVVWDQARAYDDQCCQCSQRTTKHGTSSCWWGRHASGSSGDAA